MLTREDLLFSPTRNGVPSSDDNFCADDLMAAQAALEAEARDVLPFDFTSCTYDLGPIKQPLYSCLTCSKPNGVCSACSIQCHYNHELVELFSRRDFTCDCGTEGIGETSCCSITKRSGEKRNGNNKYDGNFEGKFCFCGVKYDPHTETDEMYQCLVCEDWIHHACLFGSHSDSNTSPLSTDDFDMLICERCIKNPLIGVRSVVERWAGVDNLGVMIIDQTGKVFGTLPIEEDEEEEEENVQDGTIDEDENELERKRKVEEVEDLELAGTKRSKTLDINSISQVSSITASDSNSQASTSHETLETSRTSSINSIPPSLPSTSTSSSSLLPSPIILTNNARCTAPPLNSIDGVSTLAKIEKEGGKLNIYFAEDWRERWCRCSECLLQFIRFPYFLEEEETYEPPEDVDAFKSTEELAMEALDRLPREQAVEGAIAFQGLSVRLKAFLAPFAEQQQVVTKDMIENFFSAERERRGQ